MIKWRNLNNHYLKTIFLTSSGNYSYGKLPLKAKQLEYLLNTALDIGFPCNEEKEHTLQWVCDTYDALIGDINVEMEQVRL